MKEHYVDNWGFKDRALYIIALVVVLPIAMVLRMLFGQKEQ